MIVERARAPPASRAARRRRRLEAAPPVRMLVDRAGQLGCSARPSTSSSGTSASGDGDCADDSRARHRRPAPASRAAARRPWRRRPCERAPQRVAVLLRAPALSRRRRAETERAARRDVARRATSRRRSAGRAWWSSRPRRGASRAAAGSCLPRALEPEHVHAGDAGVGQPLAKAGRHACRGPRRSRSRGGGATRAPAAAAGRRADRRDRRPRRRRAPCGTSQSRISPMAWSMRTPPAWRMAARRVAMNGSKPPASSACGEKAVRPQSWPRGLNSRAARRRSGRSAGPAGATRHGCRRGSMPTARSAISPMRMPAVARRLLRGGEGARREPLQEQVESDLAGSSRGEIGRRRRVAPSAASRASLQPLRGRSWHAAPRTARARAGVAASRTNASKSPTQSARCSAASHRTAGAAGDLAPRRGRPVDQRRSSRPPPTARRRRRGAEHAADRRSSGLRNSRLDGE